MQLSQSLNYTDYSPMNSMSQSNSLKNQQFSELRKSVEAQKKALIQENTILKNQVQRLEIRVRQFEDQKEVDKTEKFSLSKSLRESLNQQASTQLQVEQNLLLSQLLKRAPLIVKLPEYRLLQETKSQSLTNLLKIQAQTNKGSQTEKIEIIDMTQSQLNKLECFDKQRAADEMNVVLYLDQFKKNLQLLKSEEDQKCQERFDQKITEIQQKFMNIKEKHNAQISSLNASLASKSLAYQELQAELQSLKQHHELSLTDKDAEIQQLKQNGYNLIAETEIIRSSFVTEKRLIKEALQIVTSQFSESMALVESVNKKCKLIAEQLGKLQGSIDQRQTQQILTNDKDQITSLQPHQNFGNDLEVSIIIGNEKDITIDQLLNTIIVQKELMEQLSNTELIHYQDNMQLNEKYLILRNYIVETYPDCDIDALLNLPIEEQAEQDSVQEEQVVCEDVDQISDIQQLRNRLKSSEETVKIVKDELEQLKKDNSDLKIAFNKEARLKAEMEKQYQIRIENMQELKRLSFVSESFYQSANVANQQDDPQ